MQGNEIRHIQSSVSPSIEWSCGMPFSNSKEAMKAGKHDFYSHRLACFLLTYRTTPHTTMQRTPSSLIFDCTIHTQIYLLQPNVKDQLLLKQTIQKYEQTQQAHTRSLEAVQASYI